MSRAHAAAALSEHPAHTGKTAPALPGAETVVVIPCFNEEASVRDLVTDLRRRHPDVQAVVVDDGSTDGTLEQAAGIVETIQLPLNLGIGGAVQTGLKWAHRRGAGHCVQLDGDGQHPPGELEALLSQKGTANIVVGSRFLGTGGFKSTPMRRLGSRIIAATLRICFPGCRITDPTSGFRLLDGLAIAFFARTYPHDYPEPISLAMALRCGMTVREVPIVMKARESGASSISTAASLLYMLRVVFYIVATRLSRG